MLREIRLIKQQTLNPVLPAQSTPNRKTLVLDLDETLVHSSFTSGPLFDFKVKVIGRIDIVRAGWKTGGQLREEEVRRRLLPERDVEALRVGVIYGSNQGVR